MGTYRIGLLLFDYSQCHLLIMCTSIISGSRKGQKNMQFLVVTHDLFKTKFEKTFDFVTLFLSFEPFIVFF